MTVNFYPGKTKPFVRWGRKAPGLLGKKIAELPKDKTLADSAFLFWKGGITPLRKRGGRGDFLMPMSV